MLHQVKEKENIPLRKKKGPTSSGLKAQIFIKLYIYIFIYFKGYAFF